MAEIKKVTEGMLGGEASELLYENDANLNNNIIQVGGNPFTLSGYINSQTGNAVSTTTRNRTDYLDISQSDKIVVFGGSNDTVALIAYYDENKTFISSLYGTSYDKVETTVLKANFPTNAKYIRCSSAAPITGSYCYYTTLSNAYTKAAAALQQSQKNATDIEGKVTAKNGNNLANPDNFNRTGAMVRADGSISGSGNTTYGNTGYIEFNQENDAITINHAKPHVNGYNALYDANKVYIAGTSTQNQTLNWVSGAKYAVFSIATAWTDTMVNYGSTSLSYEPYSPIAGYEMGVSDGAVTTPKIADGAVTSEKLDPAAAVTPKFGKNLFNKDTALEGYSIGSAGNPVVNANYYVSDFIPVEAGQSYAKPNTATACWYDTNRVYIAPYFQAATAIAPANAKYLRVSVPKASIDTYQVEKGTQATAYEPYSPIAGYESTSGLTMETDVALVIPNEFIAVEGDNLQIFHRSVIRAVNPFNYDIVVNCSVGKNFPRYFEFKPDSSHVGNSYSATFYVKRNDTSVIVQKAAVIRVIAKRAAPATNKNVLVVGASATANGYFTNELSRRLTTATGDGTALNPTGLNLGNITFVGRKRGSVRNIPLEATGGWSWVDYCGQGRAAYRFYVNGVTLININDEYTINGVSLVVTETNITDGTGDIRCTYTGTNTPPASGTLTRTKGSGDASVNYSSYESETFNPFWNIDTGKLDFITYANLYCNGSIDILIAHCGLNDIFAGRTGDALFNDYIKPFARALHADFPNAKFVISTLPLLDYTGGMGASYGATASNYMNRNIGIWKFADALTAMTQDAEFSSYVSQACVIQQFDNEYGYSYDTVNVNNRIPITEHRGNNGAHPPEQGAFMVADAIYRKFNDLVL